MSTYRSAIENPCLTCGACCSFFRVSFYWAEALSLGLPEPLTEQVNDFYSCMKGTNQKEPHCVALNGAVGERVSCSCYGQRPSSCRELQPGEPKCDRARAHYGLEPVHCVELADALPLATKLSTSSTPCMGR